MKRLLLIVLLVLIGCAQEADIPSFGEENPILYIDGEEEVVEVERKQIAIIETTKGTFEFELYPDEAPVTVANFVKLVNRKFYDGLIFHRVEPGFVIQGGDPTGTGTGGSGQTIPLEIHPNLKHVKGAIGMARSTDPNSASSQWYVTLADVHGLDGSYAVFGKVISGIEVTEQIQIGDQMLNVRIVER